MASRYSDVAVRFSEEDKLGFNDYADGVIDIIENISKEDTPFTIGIFGSWGSGKSSFMQIMESIVQSMSYETVFFKSWEYGNEEKPWIPFMINVVDKLFEKEIDKKKLIRNIFPLPPRLQKRSDRSQSRFPTSPLCILQTYINQNPKANEIQADIHERNSINGCKGVSEGCGKGDGTPRSLCPSDASIVTR